MHRTTVELDLDAFHAAERNLGTRGFKETLNRALEDVNRRAALDRAVRYVEDRRESLPAWEALERTRHVEA
ncbi:MAG TPA: hypothetical protein VFB57_02880 [Gaiellaceae bacterium]|jgi:hypothetical protein|nr:hypothetical protein [Gaiellaceae bacterium]